MRKRLIKPGSALILTLLMTSVIATISFGLTALTTSEFRKVASLQDSLAAFYAAEGGIEHGLMQYRLWRDAEISKEVYDKIHAGEPVPEASTPTKTNGTAQSFRVEPAPVGFVKGGETKGNPSYNLKMWYRGTAIGKLDGNGSPVVDRKISPRIFRDSALQLNVRGADSYHIAWEADPATVANPPPLNLIMNATYFIEVILSSTNPNCPIVRTIYRGNFASEKNPIAFNFGQCGYDTIRIKPWGMTYMQYSILLLENGSKMKFDNNISTIQATGYSGKSKRTLTIGVNRSIGTILESEDFLLLSGEEKIEF